MSDSRNDLLRMSLVRAKVPFVPRVTALAPLEGIGVLHMKKNWVQWTTDVLTVLGWGLVGAAAAWPGAVNFELARPAMMLAIVGTVAWVMRRNTRKVEDLFELGRQFGRAEARAELSGGEVLRLSDYQQRENTRRHADSAG